MWLENMFLDSKTLQMMYFIIIDTSTKLLVKYERITSNIREVIIDIVSVSEKKTVFIGYLTIKKNVSI